MAASVLIFRSDLVGTGKAISILFGINGVRNKRSHLVGPPFPEFKAHFSAKKITSGDSFEPNNLVTDVFRSLHKETINNLYGVKYNNKVQMIPTQCTHLPTYLCVSNSLLQSSL